MTTVIADATGFVGDLPTRALARLLGVRFVS